MSDTAIWTELSQICGAPQTLRRYLERIAYASDASFYRLIPQAVVQPRQLTEIKALFGWSQRHQIPLTFRAAGTSLSGQALSDGVLVDISRHWRGFEAHDQGQSIQAQPGVIGAHLNRILAPYGRKIGPDPASLQSCMLGGILANNASGMCCGVLHNAYHTLQAMHLVLPNGSDYHYGQPGESERFLGEQAPLAKRLLQIRQQLLADPDLLGRVRQKYQQKNTTGYGLNALVDYSDPLAILAHLCIGSEGTLAFIAEARLATIPDPQFKLTGLWGFESVQVACEQIQALTAAGAAALELLDQASLLALPATDLALWLPSQPPGACALLVEFHFESASAQQAARQSLIQRFADLPRLAPEQDLRLTDHPAEQAQIWKLRKGLYPSVGAVRQSGTAVIIEDVVFPDQHLAAGVSALQDLFQKHGYQGIIFGHARDANLHFVLTQAFHDPQDLARYDALMQDLVERVLSLGGALKAEHGTGRNVAPFVEAEWGSVAYHLMQQIKQALDPDDLLNPGVIINADPQAHLKNLKNLPSIDAEVDACTECGFCEPICPSRRVTLTPRQRIVLRREMKRLQSQTDPESQALNQQLQADYQYMGLDTCAADSLCAESCPIGLDTGALVKRLRAEQIPAWQQKQAALLARQFQPLEMGLKVALKAAHLGARWFGDQALNAMINQIAKTSGLDLPHWDQRLPAANFKRLPASPAAGARFVYFPSCISRNLAYSEQRSLPQTVVNLATQAGVPLLIPEQVGGLCCGLPFASKGYQVAGDQVREHSLQALWAASGHGHLPVVMDTSPCTQHLQAGLKGPYQNLEILDLVSFLEHEVAEHLPLQPKYDQLVVHAVCSLQKMGLTEDLLALAQRCAQQVILPDSLNCCGFAGDRGLLFPELPAAALSDVKTELAQRLQDQAGAVYCSSSRSCEMGLSLELDQDFVSIAMLLEDSLI